MKLLIDGSLNYLELVLINQDSKILDSFFIIQNKNLTNILVESIDSFLKKTGTKKNAIKELLVVNGPGSFTSIKLVSIFANTWKEFFPMVTLKQINTCLWNSTSENSINVLDAKSDLFYINYYDRTKLNEKEKVNLVSKEEFAFIKQNNDFPINVIKNIHSPIFKWELNKLNFKIVDRIKPYYVKPAI